VGAVGGHRRAAPPERVDVGQPAAGPRKPGTEDREAGRGGGCRTASRHPRKLPGVWRRGNDVKWRVTQRNEEITSANCSRGALGRLRCRGP
jgi:hypothetical protein